METWTHLLAICNGGANDDHRTRISHRSGRHMGGWHVLRVCGPATGHEPARAGHPPAALAPRVLALFSLGVAEHCSPSRQRFRDGVLGLRWVCNGRRLSTLLPLGEREPIAPARLPWLMTPSYDLLRSIRLQRTLTARLAFLQTRASSPIAASGVR